MTSINPITLAQRFVGVFARRQVNKEIMATGVSALASAASFSAPAVLVTSTSPALKTFGEVLSSQLGFLKLNQYIGGFMGLFTLKKLDDLVITAFGQDVMHYGKQALNSVGRCIKGIFKSAPKPSTPIASI